MTSKPELRVFVSSPGDVAEERAQTEQVLSDLAKAYSRHVRLDAVFWEHEPLFSHAGFQDQLPPPRDFDLVIVLLWSRIGTRLPSNYAPEPGRPTPTGTEFEIRDSLAGHRERGRPDLLVYLKTATVLAAIDEHDTPERLTQFQRLRAFVTENFHEADGAGSAAYHTFPETAAFVAKLRHHVETWLKRQLAARQIHGATRSWTSGSPFRGLEVFDAEHRAVFFGRSAAVSAVLRLLQDREAALRLQDGGLRCLIVHGLSGNGKSSLIRAGVLPLLRIGALDGVGLIRQAILRPGSAGGDVFAALVQALRTALPEIGADTLDAERALAADLVAGADAAPLLIRSVITALASARGLEPAHVRVVLLVDQLEELFTVAAVAREQRTSDGSCMTTEDRFGRALSALARSGMVWIVATLRSDFTHQLERTDAWRAISRDALHFTLQKPTADELAEMVREPASVAGLRYEERDGLGLDRRLLDEASHNTESLPLVEFVLDELWKRYEDQPSNDGELRHADYEALGGLSGALQRAAEAALSRVSGSEADRLIGFRNVMRQLVRIGEGESEGKALRRDAAVDGFALDSGERRLVDALVDARLCVTDAPASPSSAAVPRVRIAHEALLSCWPRVQHWLQQDGELLRIRDRVSRDAEQWQRHGRPKDLLASDGKRLDEIKTVAVSGMPLSEIVAAFVARSRERAALKRRVRASAAVALLLLATLMTLLAVFASRSRQQERARFVDAFALQLAADARANFSLRGDSEKGIRQLLAARSLGSAISFESDMHAALVHQMSATKTFADRPAVTALHYSSDGNTLLSGHVDGTLRWWNPHTRRERRVVEAHADAINAMALDAGGNRVLSAGDDGVVRQWSVDDGTRIGVDIDAGPAPLLSMAVDSAGETIVGGAADGTLRIWRVADGHLVAGPIGAHRDPVRSIARVPGSASRFVSGGQDGVVRAWRFDGTALGTPMRIGAAAMAIAASPDGHEIAVGDEAGMISTWNLETGAESRPPLRGHASSVTALTYSGDGLQLASGSVDQTVRLWRPDYAPEPRVLGDSGGFVRGIAFSPDSARIAAGGNGAALHTWDSRAEGSTSIGIALQSTSYASATFSPDDRRVLVYASGFDDFEFRLLDSRTGRLICQVAGDGTSLDSLRFDPAGRRIVALRTAPETVVGEYIVAPDAVLVTFWDAENCARHEREIRIGVVDRTMVFASMGFVDGGNTLRVRLEDREQRYDAVTLDLEGEAKVDNPDRPGRYDPFDDEGVDPVPLLHGEYAVMEMEGFQRSVLKRGERTLIEFDGRVHNVTFSADGELLMLSTDTAINLMPAPGVWAKRLCAMLGGPTTEDSLRDLRPEDIAYVDPCLP